MDISGKSILSDIILNFPEFRTRFTNYRAKTAIVTPTLAVSVDDPYLLGFYHHVKELHGSTTGTLH